MFYHIRISQKSSQSYDETKLGLTEEELRVRVLEPYENGRPIIINGKTVPSDDIERIRITRSTEAPEQLVHRAEMERQASSIVVIPGPSNEWLAADLSEDISDNLIQGPPGYKKDEMSATAEAVVCPSNKKVFVVHGHDHLLKNDLEVFLRDIGLDPIVLHRKPDEGLTIIEKFEKHADVRFVCILLTPDDMGFPVGEYKKPEADRSYEERARQNVIFEWGYFLGKIGRGQVCCIYKAGVKLPSDMSGLLYAEVKESIEEIGYKLIREFKAAGLAVRV